MKQLLYEIRYYLAAVVLVIWLVPDTEKQPSEPGANATIMTAPVVKSSQNKATEFAETESDKAMRVDRPSGAETGPGKNEKTIEKNRIDLFPQPNRH